MNDSPPSPSRLLRTYATVVRWFLWLLVAMWLAIAIVWGAIHGWIVPRIGDFRPDLEIEATRVLGVPVRIGGVSARSAGLVPSFELSDVSLLDPQGREALRLPRVVAALSPRSLWNLGFEQLYIERPALDIRRAADGRIYVAGLDFSRGSDNDGRAADWFFSQTEFVIRGGTLRWTDELNARAPLALSGVDFVARNRARRHALRLDATPPPEWGERFSLRGLFRQPLLSARAGQWRDWDGQLHADFSRVDVAQLREHVRGLGALGVEVRAGQGALRAWADVTKGEVTGGVADVVLAGVSTTLGERLQPLALASLSGRLAGRRLASGFDFSTQNLQFRTSEGLVWPGGNVALSWTGAEGKMPAQGELKADRLDLAALSQVASRLPLGTATHAALAAYDPKGLVESVQARWQGPLNAPLSYQAKGRASGLQVDARAATLPRGGTATHAPAGSPGVRGAALDFDLTQAGGKARLAVTRGALELPGVFEDPVVPVDELSAQLAWQINGPQISLSVNDLKFANADAEGQAQVSWRTADPARSAARSRFPGVLDLSGTLSRAEGTRVHRYLPLAVGKTARDYVREAVLQGRATGVKFRVRGDLRDMPFNDPKQGEFRVSANVGNATFAFVPRTLTPRGSPAWPPLTQLAGELVFERSSMQINNATARLAAGPGVAGVQVTRAEARIPDLAHTTTVLVSAEVRGPLAESLAVVRGSPLSPLLGHALDGATATGNADVRLKLTLPVNTIDRSRVQGSVTLAGNDVQITPDSPVLSRARGVVQFSETGFALAGAQARMLGGDVRLDGGSRVLVAGSTEPSVALRAQGNFTAEGLRQARELGFFSRLGQSMQGGAAYSATLAFRRGTPELAINSSLQGLALNLPPPLNKPADAALPLRYDNSLLREAQAPGTRLMDQISLELGRVATVAYVRDLTGAQARVLRGAIGVGLAPGESAPLPEQGVLANVNLGTVDIDAWERALAGASGASLAPPSTAAPASTSTQPAATASPAQNFLPTIMAVRARELLVDGRTLHNVVVGGSRDGQLWRANADADELGGYVEYRQPVGAGSGRVYARLARLNIAAGAAREVENLLNEQPASIPALDVVVEELVLKGKSLGRVEIDAVNRGAGAVAREGGMREWRLNKLNLSMPEATFTATGNWAALGAQPAAAGGPRPAPRNPAEARRTVMNFRLDIADSGQLLSRFGMKDVIRRGRGRMEGQVAWLGSPLTMDYPSLNGAFNVNIEAGQFLKADPGLAKLLGVLSLQALPRRLTLDFRDVFSEGFAFDFVRGDVAIVQGIASTNNLQMKGVNAAVLMEGKADIARETQDLKVVVVPEINAGTASLVATVINPVVGIGTFLAQMVLRNPLIRAATQEFHIDGTWADPRVTRVERRAAPSASAPSTATPTQ